MVEEYSRIEKLGEGEQRVSYFFVRLVAMY
jgi:hypothetical protein